MKRHMRNTSIFADRAPISTLRDQQPGAVFFLHIPKTGGVTMRTLLRDVYGPGALCPYTALEDLASASPSQFREYPVVAGEFPFYVSELLTRPLFSFTFLRDPVERTLSVYKHLRRDVNHPDHARMAEVADLAEFLAHPALRTHVVNAQTRFLGCHSDLAQQLERCRRDALTPEASRPYLKAPIRQAADEVTLRQALVNLEKISFVGATERFAECCRALFNRLGFKEPLPIPKANCAPAKQGPRLEDLDPGMVAAIRRVTRFDRHLYAVARRRVEDSLGRAEA